MKKVEAKLENEVKMAVDMAFPKTPPNGLGAKNRDTNKDSETSFGAPNANTTGEKSQRLIDSAVHEGSVATNSPQIHEHYVSESHSPPGSGHKSPRAIAPKKSQRIGTNMALQFEVPTPDADTSQANIEVDPVKDNQGRAGNDDGIIVPNYEYSTGNCPEDGDSTKAVPCAPDNLYQICDKTDPDDQGKFSLCFDACLPSFCCIHGKMIGAQWHSLWQDCLPTLKPSTLSHPHQMLLPPPISSHQTAIQMLTAQLILAAISSGGNSTTRLDLPRSFGWKRTMISLMFRQISLRVTLRMYNFTGRCCFTTLTMLRKSFA
jgi:hypothetical protein